jgi:hypothetical protein
MAPLLKQLFFHRLRRSNEEDHSASVGLAFCITLFLKAIN